MDFNKLASDLEISIEIFMDLVDAWIQSTAEDIEGLGDASKNNDFQRAAARSHKIKGASSQLGFTEIAAAAKNIELNAREGNLDGLDEAILNLKNMRDKIVTAKNDFKTGR